MEVTRRAILSGIGLAGAAGVGGLLYRAAPNFWKQMAREMGRPIAQPPAIPDPKRWPDSGIHAAWLGHATVLFKIDGFIVLTDPVFSIRAGLNFGPLTLGLKRLVAPALEIEQLPKIDLILLSHAHMDHMDLPSLRKLENTSVPVVTATGTSDLLRVPRYREVRELGWEQETQIGPLLICGLEVNHWGARMRTDTWRGYNGYRITAGRYTVLFAGDTANTDLFRRARGPRPTDLAIMPIGTYNPWIRYHCTPEQAWRMGNDARAEFFIPVHHRTFQLSREPLGEPLERFLSAAGNEAARVAVRAIGQEFGVG